jgi:hypothetical protein
MNDSVKRVTLVEIEGLVPADGELEWHKDCVSIRRWATDRAGTYIWKAFRKVDGDYVEFDFLRDVRYLAKYLAKNITASRIIREVLLKVSLLDLTDLKERIENEAKVTVGVQRGSCVYLYIRGKRGQPAQLQLTE